MGKRGPKPKPTALRVFEGTRVQRPSGRGDEPTPPASNSTAPAWLGEHGKREWDRVVPLLGGVGCFTDVDYTAMALYCRCLDDYHQCLATVKASGITCEGSNNNVIVHPAYRAQCMAVSLMVKLGAPFGINGPAGRVGLSGAPQDPGIDDLEKFKAGTA